MNGDYSITKNGCFINWRWITDEPKTENQAEEFQMGKRFHPAGYGFYSFDCRKDLSGIYISTWFCDNSTGD